MKIRLLPLLLLTISCGKAVDVQVPKKITFGPNFEEIASFCDRRYGEKTKEAESCFSDYRTYFKVLSTGPVSIDQFCEQYTDPIKKQACLDNLDDLLAPPN